MRDRAYDGLRRMERRRGGYCCFFEPNALTTDHLEPTVATMHDLSVLDTPEFHPPERIAHWDRWLRFAMDATTHWISVSQATAQAMTRLLGINADKITVIPLASRWPAAPDFWQAASVRRRLGLPDRYLVCLGTIEPRKNVLRLLDAYARLPSQDRRRTPLILVGMNGWGDEAYWSALRRHAMAGEVMITGYLDDPEAAAILFGARGLLYPSFYEGFGLPPLEAMALGTPVAVSTAESLLEVSGPAALVVDPTDTEGWTDAMQRLAADGDERTKLINAGRIRAGQFSWESTVLDHLEVLASVAGQG